MRIARIDGWVRMFALLVVAGGVSSADAATVKMTQSNGVCHTFVGVPCCVDWTLSSGTSCKDDCNPPAVIAAVTTVAFDDVTVSLLDDQGIVIDVLNNDTGVFDFVGLDDTDAYRVSIDSAAVGGFLGAFDVANTDRVSFALVPEPAVAAWLAVLLAGARRGRG